MFKKFLQKLESLAWSKKANEEQQIQHQPGSMESMNVPQQPEVDNSTYWGGSQYESFVQPEDSSQQQSEVSQWVDQNIFGNTPMPVEWDNPSALNEFFSTIRSRPEDKQKIQDWVENVAMRDINAARLQKSDEYSEEDIEELSPEDLMESFSNNQADFLNKIRSRLARKYGDEAADEAFSNFQTRYLSAPQDPSKAQDNRLALLTRPLVRTELEQVPEFAARLDNFFANPENLQTMSSIVGFPVTRENFDEAFEQIQGSRQLRRRFINEGLAPLLQESFEGMNDSLLDAIGQLSEGELPENLRNFYMKAMDYLSKQEITQTSKRRQQEGVSLNAPVGKDEGEIGQFVSDESDSTSDTRMDTDEESEAFFGMLRNSVTNKLDDVKGLANHIVRAYHAYYDPEINPDAPQPKDESKKRGSDLPATIKVPIKEFGDVNMSVADIISAYIPAATANISRLIQPGNNRQKRDAFKNMQRQNKKEGNPAVSFSDRGGRIEIEQQGESFQDLGINLRGLVNASSLRPYFNRMGEVKEKIHNYSRQYGQNPDKIAEIIAKDYNGNPGFPVTNEFVKSTLKEDPSVADAFKYVANKTKILNKKSGKKVEVPDNKAITSISEMVKYNWTKMFPFIFHAIDEKDFNPESREMFLNLVGAHKNFTSPITSEEEQQLSQIDPELLEGKQWWEATESALINAMHPVPPGAGPEEIKEIEKERKRFAKRLRGTTSVKNMERIYEIFMGGKVPDHVDKWLKYRSQTKGQRKKEWTNIPEEYARRQAKALQRMVLAYHRHAERIDNLVRLRNQISKFSSTGDLDDRISRAREAAFTDLQQLSRLV